MKNYHEDKMINECIKEMVYSALYQAFKRNGIEGTEQKIKQLTDTMKRNLLLKGYNDIVFGKRG